jgi:hypothetical protein
MKKYLLCLSLLLSVLTASYAQTTATDFTATDCASVSHNFFSELNSGKVVVLNWVMPCSTCIPASVSAYNIVQGFASSNPGQVLHYLIDDNGGTTCSTLINWGNTNGISAPGTTVFRNSGSAINEADYGGSGMPHIAVVGPDHQIYFNGLNGAANNPTAVATAISQALLASGIQQPVNVSSNLFVTTAPEKVTVHYTLTENETVTLNLLNELGQTVSSLQQGKQPSGKHNAEFDLSGMAEGIYFIRLNTENSFQSVKFNVTK